jgi:hypothetical protein
MHLRAAGNKEVIDFRLAQSKSAAEIRLCDRDARRSTAPDAVGWPQSRRG